MTRAAARRAPARVLIADDSPAQREGWRMILAAQPDLMVAGEVGDGARALAVVRREPIDVVLMDLHMPRVNGLAASERITTDSTVRELGPVPRIVLATAVDLDDHVVGAAQAGVFAVIYKDLEPEAFLSTIRAAAHAHDPAPTAGTGSIRDRRG